MRLSAGYSKLSQTDVRDLNTASECIASAANAIQQLRPQWAPAVVQLLVQANDIVVRIQNRGATCIANYIEKHQGLRVTAATEAVAALAETGQESSIESESE